MGKGNKMAFGLFNYKPSPGVDKGRPIKNRFSTFFELYFRKFWKLLELNLLFALLRPHCDHWANIAGIYLYSSPNYADERQPLWYPTF